MTVLTPLLRMPRWTVSETSSMQCQGHLDEPVVFDGSTLPELTEALLEQNDIDSGNVPSALLGRGVSAGLAPIYFPL